MAKYQKSLAALFEGDPAWDSLPSVADLLGQKEIILYGAGDGFRNFSVYILNKFGLHARAILDRKFKTGDCYDGIPAYSPLDYQPTRAEKEKAVVVITVGKTKFHEEIIQCLRGLGFQHILLASDIYEYHLPYLQEELAREGFQYFINRRPLIEQGLRLFSDELSREIFLKFVQTHMKRKPVRIPSAPADEQYFPNDIHFEKGYKRFINCGAYDGDTVRRLHQLFGKIDSLACFEPDPENFQSLKKYLDAHSGVLANQVIAFPVGVFSSEKNLRFSGGNGFISAISADGDSNIQCVALDQVLSDFKPTFVNMDVEGAELEALKGAEILIKESLPDLAICVYHFPAHIWEIPLYLASVNSSYRFYLRNYSSFTDDTVLYATTTVKERNVVK